MTNARWLAHINAVQSPLAMREWLAERGSLTKKLIAHSRHFEVRRLHQGPACCTADEATLLGLARPVMVQQREVALYCDARPLVYGHTVLPLASNATDWPFFRALGNRSLGNSLFGDPLVRRGSLQFARLRPTHPLAQRAAAALGMAAPRWFARRCVYWRKGGILLVTEVFSPAIAGRISRQAL